MVKKYSILIILFCSSPFFAGAQSSQGFLYGEIVLNNGEKYEGQIRWTKKEAQWNDMFDAIREERPINSILTREESKKVESQAVAFNFGFMELWKDKTPDTKFAFRCNFGDLTSIKVIDAKTAIAQLKNGENIRLLMGTQALKNEIQIFDTGLGMLNLDIKSIRAIYFKPAPANMIPQGGKPMYGSILTTLGVFEGFIKWDMDECLGKDLIGGRSKGNVIEIEFENIIEIKAQEDGSLITLKSGRAIFLNNHNDVSSGNHGILIRNLSWGKLYIPWKNFISAKFFDSPTPPASYESFLQPKVLTGQVATKSGQMHQGHLIYDLDERYDMEYLNGKNNDFTYHILFAQVDRVEPQNDKFSLIYLKDGQQILLGNNGDVTARNHGLIVQSPGREAAYIRWINIKTIEFE